MRGKHKQQPVGKSLPYQVHARLVLENTLKPSSISQATLHKLSAPSCDSLYPTALCLLWLEQTCW